MEREQAPMHGRGGFADVMREARIDARIGLRELARVTGLSPSFISDVERGNRNPPRQQVVRVIASTLGLDPDMLVKLAADAHPTRHVAELDLQQYADEQVQMALTLARRWDAGELDAETARRILTILRGGNDENQPERE